MAGWFHKRRASASIPAKYDDPMESVPPTVFAEQAERRLAHAEKTLLRRPENVQAWNEKAWALLDLRRYKESINAADQAIALDPRYAWAWNNKGAALGRLERTEEALACYEQALALDPKNSLVWRNKAKVLLRLDRLQEALEAGGIAARLNPQDAILWWDQYRALRAMKRYDAALAALDEFLARAPSSGEAWAEKAAIYCYDLRQYDDAIACAEEALKWKPHSLYAMNVIGVADLFSNRLIKALTMFQKVLSLEPMYAAALNNKGFA